MVCIGRSNRYDGPSHDWIFQRSLIVSSFRSCSDSSPAMTFGLQIPGLPVVNIISVFAFFVISSETFFTVARQGPCFQCTTAVTRRNAMYGLASLYFLKYNALGNNSVVLLCVIVMDGKWLCLAFANNRHLTVNQEFEGILSLT